MRTVRWLAELADWLLDCVPSREDGRWYRHGNWGCRLRLHRIWDDPEGRSRRKEDSDD